MLRAARMQNDALTIQQLGFPVDEAAAILMLLYDHTGIDLAQPM
jgi:hypothetical protein